MLGSASAQYDERAAGGPHCWRVINKDGAIVSVHSRQTKAQVAAFSASENATAHVYANPCIYNVTGPNITPLPDPQPGQVLLIADAVLTRGQQTGMVWDEVVLDYSMDGGETWQGAMRLTFNVAHIFDAIAVDAVKIRFRVPEGAN